MKILQRLIAIAFLCTLAFGQAALLPIPRQQFLDINGHPLAGGKVYTYAAGTSTPQPTFTDSTGLIQQPNPVILDAGGFATIWVGAQYYKIVVTDSADVIQYTVDNVSSYNLPFVTSWSFAEGAGCVGAVNYDVLCGLSASHRLAFLNNNGTQDIIVGQNTTDTLTNKTLTSPSIITPTIDTPTFVGNVSVSALFSLNTPVSTTGFGRFGSTDKLCWRNNGDSANFCQGKNVSDQFTFDSDLVLGTTGTDVTILAADNGTVTGMNLNLNGGASTVAGGGVLINGGGGHDVGAAHGSGGDVTITGGPAFGTGQGGHVVIAGGGSISGAQGLIDLNSIVNIYGAVQTVRNGIAAEYAALDQSTPQSAAVPSTSLYNPPALPGIYVLTFTAAISQAATTSSVLGPVSLICTNNDTSTVVTIAGTTSAGNTTGTAIGGTLACNVKTGTDIRYSVGYTSVGGTVMKYVYHLTLARQ